MNRRNVALATGLSLLGIAVCLIADSMLLLTAGGLLITLGVLIGQTAVRHGHTAALIRIDWFLPALRKTRADRPARPIGWSARAARRVLPKSFFSDRQTKQRGLVRRWLRGLGISWLSAPVRRVVQAICLLAFCWLFLVTCWPYDATPRPAASSSRGWRVIQLDQEDGDVTFEQAGAAPRWRKALAQGAQLYASAQSESLTAVASNTTAIPLKVKAASGRIISASPRQIADAETLITNPGPWTLYDDDPARWPDHYSANLSAKEWLPADLFLVIDPLVAISTAIASRSWVWSLACAGVILLVCVLIPRGFCGYLCPLGTVIELFDWSVSRHVRRFQVAEDGWWVHIKYYLLTGILVAAAGGVLISGVFAAIPVITRAFLFLVDPAQTGLLRGRHLIPPTNWGHLLSIGLFAAILGLGFLRPRFWCKYVCPSGAVFSLGNLFRITERKVESSCIHCNKCVEVCPFDAIKPDFTTRVTDCTECQTCAGVCPTHAIKFVERWNLVELKVENDPPTNETAIGRRGFLSAAAGGTAAVLGGLGSAGGIAASRPRDPFLAVRPPGSVPEESFLQMCIRCGECFKACPNNVLQAEGFQQGLAGLWTPLVNADWAGCESSCNNCGQVCPTGAIRPLPLFEKRHAKMGLAIVNEATCLPFAGREACDLCVQECNAAGYEAIEYIQVGTEVDDQGAPIPDTGYLAPRVDAAKCVGCGLCQTRCYAINVKDRHVLDESAIIIEAGPGKEDRLMSGSYRDLRRAEEEKRQQETTLIPEAPPQQPPPTSEDSTNDSADDNPFGL